MFTYRPSRATFVAVGILLMSAAGILLMSARSGAAQAPVPAVASTTRALLIGAWDYEHYHKGTFPNLHAKDEVEALGTVLKDQYRFGHVTEVTSAETTTHDGILGALQNLVSQTRPHDIVYVHFSGHGSEVPDPTDPQTGLDQTIVPTDYKEDGSFDIRDKQLAQILHQIVAKKPDSVTVTFDCCHSGSMTRGRRLLVRGRTWEERQEQGGKSAAAFSQNAPAKPSLFLTTGQAKDSGFVVLSACADDQGAIEDPDLHMGRFTVALVAALKEARSDTTYGDLFDRINSLLVNRYAQGGSSQNPQMEGNPQLLVMSGAAGLPDRSIPVFVTHEGHLQLQAGALQGMTTGSKFALYARGTGGDTGAKLLATATVGSPGSLTAPLTLDPDCAGVSLLRLQDARAQETSHQYGDLHFKIDPHDLASLPDGPAITAVLAANTFVTTDLRPGEHPDVIIRRPSAAKDGAEIARGSERDDPASIVLERFQDGSLITQIPAGPDLPHQISDTLGREARWERVKDLQNADASEIQADLKIVPVAVTLSAGGKPNGVQNELPVSREAEGGRQRPLQFPEGTYFILKVRVRTTGTILHPYVAILDLEGEGGSIAQLWPSPQDTNRDNQVTADGQWRTIGTGNGPSIYRITKPYGVEVFKAIVTKEYVSYAPLIDLHRSGQARGTTPLGLLISDAATSTGSTARGPEVDPHPADWSTTAVSFLVSAK